MHHRLYNALRRSSEMRALFVLGIVIVLRAWRVIPTLRPHQMMMPAALMQIIVLVLAGLTEHFIFGFVIGNFVIVAFLMLPLMLRPAEVKAQ